MSNHETVQSATALELGAAMLQQLPRDMTQEVALGWIWNKRALGKVLREVLMPPAESAAPRTSLLEPLRTADVSAWEVFKAADFFTENGQPNGIKFWLAKRFKNHLLKDPGKIELDFPASTLNVYKLREPSLDGPILAALGGNDAAKTCLAYIAQLIKAQPKGEEGVLLTNGKANFFYVDNNNGELLTVICSWESRCSRWDVGATPVSHPDRWDAGRLVFSPALLLP